MPVSINEIEGQVEPERPEGHEAPERREPAQLPGGYRSVLPDRTGL